jgi:hypothetical protein
MFLAWKPSRTWRRLLGEVGIVVLGVLIALVAQQSAEDWDWRKKSRAAEDAIRAELLYSVAHADERIRMSKCFEGKLDQIQKELTQKELKIEEPLHRSRYWTIVRFWSTDAWDTARSGAVLTHMPQQKVSSYSAMYAQVALVSSNLAWEQRQIADLALLTWFTGELSGQTRDRLLASTTQARRSNEMILRDAKQFIAAAREMNIKLGPQTRTELVPCGSLNGPTPF